MSTIQHELAHKVLSLIRKQKESDIPLTYTTAAIKLGRKADSARAVAQACDLLDAASALANIPILSLVKVFAANGKINPKAWKKNTPAGVRDKIIKRSRAHTFTDDDYTAVELALQELSGLGNHRAWDEVKNRIPGNLFYQQLTTETTVQVQDAINDLGTDKPDRALSTGIRYARDPKVRKKVLTRAKGKCEFCGKQGFDCSDGSKYLETHHIIALSKDGADRITNVIALCPEHHREAHYGKRSHELEKMMFAKIKS
jgi:hypothetical protein